jgi:hypothetical protein
MLKFSGRDQNKGGEKHEKISHNFKRRGGFAASGQFRFRAAGG